jgi:hypothetical protein
MDAVTLHEAIAEVCPIISASVGDENDRATWSYLAGESATTEQIAAADDVVATIPIETKTVLIPSDFIGRFTNAEYRAATAAGWRQTGPNAKNWDVVVFDATINLNKKKVTSLKDSLVAGGVLTSARANEIFV